MIIDYNYYMRKIILLTILSIFFIFGFSGEALSLEKILHFNSHIELYEDTSALI